QRRMPRRSSRSAASVRFDCERAPSWDSTSAAPSGTNRPYRTTPNSNNREMPDNTFDVVSKIEMPEVVNAVQQAMKELIQRYDLKDSHSSIELKEKENKIVLASSDEFKLKAVVDILQ